jgi:hypothetical protein
MAETCSSQTAAAVRLVDKRSNSSAREIQEREERARRKRDRSGNGIDIAWSGEF